DHVGQWYRRHEQSYRLCPVLVTKPVTEVDYYSREKSRLRRSKKEPYPIKLILRMYEAGEDCQYPPRNHYACYPTSRAPLFNEDASGNLEQEITHKKNAGAPTHNIVGEPQIGLHIQRGIADIRPVQIGNDVKHEQVRHDPQHNSSPCPFADITGV